MASSGDTSPAVSGLVCGSFLSFVEAHGGSEKALVAGLGVTSERLRQWHAWFPWEIYLALEERFGRIMAHMPEPYLELGRYVVAQRQLGVAGIVFRGFATPLHGFRILPRIVPRILLRGVSVELAELSRERLDLTYRFAQHVEPTGPLAETIRGQLVAAPTLLGQAEAEVKLASIQAHLIHYEVHLPVASSRRGSGALARFRSGLWGAGRRTRVLMDLGGELLRTNELLGHKLRELEEANRRLHKEAHERQKVTAAVRASEERYRLLAETADDAIAVLDGELKLRYVNRSGAALLGGLSQNLVNRSLFELMPAQNSLSVQESVRWVMRTGLPLRGEGSMLLGDRERFFDTSFAPLKEGRGAGEAVLCIAREVTARKLAERERAQVDARLRHAERLESMGVLVGGIAHDFNNLLTVVRGNAELARERLGQGHGVWGLLGPILDATQEGAELCRLMLAFAAKGVLPQSHVDLSAALWNMENLLRASMPHKAELRLELAHGLPLVLGDATQLRQLALNLVMNAAESLGRDPGRVTLRTGSYEPVDEALWDEDLTEVVLAQPSSSEACGLFIEVEDTGCGMDKETRARAFDPFFTTKFPGRGLGLPAVLGIVRRHGGLLTVRSSPGKGTLIRACFAAAPVHSEAIADSVCLAAAPVHSGAIADSVCLAAAPVHSEAIVDSVCLATAPVHSEAIVDSGMEADQQVRMRAGADAARHAGFSPGHGCQVAGDAQALPVGGKEVDLPDRARVRGTVGEEEVYLPDHTRVRGTVLLVDDEPEILEVGRAILESLGFEVLTASDGREALELFSSGSSGNAVITAAILDITMPRMDGEELFRSLREMTPSLPILLISGHGVQEVEARFGAMRPYAYLPKPFSIQELSAALGKIRETLSPSNDVSWVRASCPP